MRPRRALLEQVGEYHPEVLGRVVHRRNLHVLTGDEEVDSDAGVVLHERRQGLGEQMVAPKRSVGERHDLGEEGVDPHEPAEGVPEAVLLVVVV